MIAETGLARRLATVKASDREIVLRDVPIGESPYNLLRQVNATLAQSCQPFVAWRLEWISGEVDRYLASQYERLTVLRIV